jgi:hypothetical protein
VLNLVKPDPNIPTDQLRIRFGYRVILAGFILIGATVLIAWGIWANRAGPDQLKIQDLVAIISTVTGIVGTVVGAFFGVNAAGAARDQSDKARKDAQDVANRALALLPPERGSEALGH